MHVRKVIPDCRAAARSLWVGFIKKSWLFISLEAREAHVSQLEVANKVTFNQREAQEEI